MITTKCDGCRKEITAGKLTFFGHFVHELDDQGNAPDRHFCSDCMDIFMETLKATKKRGKK